MRSFFLSLLSVVGLLGDVSRASLDAEDYAESLTFRPLRDGKLAARFAFTTLLAGVSPRSPNSLVQDDTRAHTVL